MKEFTKFVKNSIFVQMQRSGVNCDAGALKLEKDILNKVKYLLRNSVIL